MNPLGNDVVYVGGLLGTGDAPYQVPGNPGLGRGTPVYPGTSVVFQVANSNLLSVIASRNGDIITFQVCLSMTNFNTTTSDPPANPVTVPGFMVPTFVVVSSNPPNGSINVATNTIINIIFNTQLNPATVNLTNVSVSPSVGAVTVSVDPNNQQINIDPHGFNWGIHTYTITVGLNVKDIFARPLQNPYVYTFTTVLPPPPIPLMVSVPNVDIMNIITHADIAVIRGQ